MTLPAYAMQQTDFAQAYERWIVPSIFKPWAAILLDRAQLNGSDDVLDIACGTGIVAREAKQRLPGARVVGVDVSPEMLAVARATEPAIDWREGNAEALPLGDGEQFDVALCQQGLQFFADKPKAAREMRRALKSGGRLVVAAWTVIEDNPFSAELHRVAERRLGPFTDQRHGFGEPQALERVLREAGFEDVRVERISLTTRSSDPPSFVRLTSQASVGMSPASSNMPNDERAKVLQLLVEENTLIAQRYINGGELAFEMRSNVATARAA